MKTRSLVVGIMLLVLVTTNSGHAAAIGVIAGRVLDGSTDAPRADVSVVLIAGDANGDLAFTRQVRTGRDGRYRFGDLPTGDGYFYSLDARFDGGTFAGGAITIPADTEKRPVFDTVLRVWPTTTDPSSIAIRRDDMFVVTNDQGAGVIEAVTVVNSSNRAYIGRGASDSGADGPTPSLGFALPSGARDIAIVEADIDIPELVAIDAGVATTIAIPPGETRITLSYALEASAGNIDLSRPALYPTDELSIHAEDPFEIRSNRLEPNGEVTLGDTRYLRWTSGAPLSAGDPLQALAIASGSPSLWPVIAVIAALVAIAGGMMVVSSRRNRAPRDEAPPDRERLIADVARLDIRHEAGEIPDDVYERQRAQLRDRIASL